MLSNTADWCFRKKWIVVGLWIVVIAGVNLAQVSIGTAFNGGRELPESESARGLEVLDTHFRDSPIAASGLSGTIVFHTDQGVDDPAVVAAMTKLFTDVAAIEKVTVGSPYALPAGAFQVSKDRTTAFGQVRFDSSLDQQDTGKIGTQIAGMLPTVPGLDIELGGSALAEFKPPSSEAVGLAFAVVVLIFAFGSVLAMGLPVAVAVGGVATGLALSGLLSNLAQMPDFSTTIGAMIGLGVGIDYALFIVTRYREALHRGESPLQATRESYDTAGRAVVFAGMTVVVSMFGMVIIGLGFVSGLAYAASVTVIATMAASLTLLPALLGLAAGRIEVTRWRGLIAAGLFAVALLGVGLKFSPLMVAGPAAVLVLAVGMVWKPLKQTVPPRRQRPHNETVAYRWSHWVQQHPWSSVVAGLALMSVLAIPLFSLHMGFSDDGNFPEDTTTRQAYDMLAEGFGPGFNGPLLIAFDNAAGDALTRVPAVVEAVAADPGVAQVTPPIPSPDGQAMLARVIPTTSPQDRETEELVRRLREDVVPSAVGDSPMQASVTGFVAIGIDFTSYLGERMLLFFAAVLALSFLLLMAVFRSLLVPLKAVFMNLISIAAAYGVVVAVFQWGWGGNVISIDAAPIEPFIPMMMFAIVFGLSMDYEVFLLSRVKEEYDKHGDARNSVADGLAATARVITAAAAIMVVVFGSFLFESSRIPKMFGVGLAIAVLLDATVVRMLLVPATMELLGAKNWWIPRWLDRIIPKISVEGPSTHHE